MIDADIAAASRSGSRRNLYDDNPMVQADRRLITDGPSTERTGRIVLASLIATLGPLSFGYCLGYSSSAVEDFKNETHNGTHLSESQGSWFGVSSTFQKAVASLNIVKYSNLPTDPGLFDCMVLRFTISN